MSIIDPLSIDGRISDVNVRSTLEGWRDQLNQILTFIHIGSDVPENNETGSVGQIFLRTDGGAKTSIYVKESGTNTKTGWIAVRT